MRRFLTLLLAVFAIQISIHSQNIKSPSVFLGYEPGSQFTYHHRAVDYFKYIAEVSPMAEYISYGETNEGRQLGVCVVSTPENLSHLEEYRKNNLIKTGLAKGEFTGKQIPFIWLAYNVHGNEANGMEAAMQTLWTLVTGSYPGISECLNNSIVIIDPCQNPDGRELYTVRYRESQSLLANPDPDAWEHNQTWPGARANHYMFDLNRDWTWQTQAETRQRLKLYQSFMPQVHADFHEMGPDATFFFAPAAEPWHTVLTPWQHEFHNLMGKENASLFDSKNRLYFTKENFDLFYPSYGDTWPLYNGAMGFTFEQGGGGVTGRALELESGDTLTLKERIEGHFISSMATIKAACNNRDKLLSEFNKYFDESTKNPSFRYKSIIVKGSNERSNVEDMLKLLDINQIKYSLAGNTGKKYKGFDYLANKDGEVNIEKGDILISAYQPESHFLEVLFEPDSRSADSLTYDITAWSIPYVYNLKSFALTDKVPADTSSAIIKKITNQPVTGSPYAYVVNFTGFNELKFMAALFRKDMKVRYSLKPFDVGSAHFNRGSLIIARGDNKNFKGDLDKTVLQAANDCSVTLSTASTGLVDTGKDFGSGNTPLATKVDVAVICGEGPASGNAGELWYFFEQELKYPVSMVTESDAVKTNLTKYNVIVLPSGSYKKTLRDTIVDYVKRGGKVIAMENSISIFAARKNTALSKASDMKSAEVKAAEKKAKSDDTTLLKKFEYKIERRYSLQDKSTGSIYRIKLDDTHPYAFGMGKEWFVIKRTEGIPFLGNGYNIGWIEDKDPVEGFAGSKFRDKMKNTLAIGSESIGSGEVIYITDDPYFRAFWKSGRVLLGNMILR